MSDSSLKISIVIPVYNVNQYLGQCIESVCHQTYDNIEIILVDDGSTDGSDRICDTFAEKYSKIKAVHKVNGGPAAARETGLSVVSGEYVMFIDGDDWISADTVERCVRAVMRYPSLDCVLFSYSKEYPDHSVPMHIFDRSFYMKGKRLEYAVYRRLFGLYGKEMGHPERMETLASCCMKLYKTELAKKGRSFNLKNIGSAEDALFNMYALYGLTEAVYLDRCFYHYRKRGDSLTNAHRPDLREQWKNLFRIMASIIDEKHLDGTYKEVLLNRIAVSIASISLNEIANKEHTVAEHLKEIKSYLNDEVYRESCRKAPVRYLPFVWKIYMICAKLKLSLPIFLMSQAIILLRKR